MLILVYSHITVFIAAIFDLYYCRFMLNDIYYLSIFIEFDNVFIP